MRNSKLLVTLSAAVLLGLVTQKDGSLWQDETGAPIDVQPGNIAGGKRLTLRGVDFNNEPGPFDLSRLCTHQPASATRPKKRIPSPRVRNNNPPRTPASSGRRPYATPAVTTSSNAKG